MQPAQIISYERLPSETEGLELGERDGKLRLYNNVSLIKTHCNANFLVCANSPQTKKFVVQEPKDGPSEKRPIIELMSFIIKLAL